MEYVCDASKGLTWFRLMTEAEAANESAEMRHAVEKHFRREREKASHSFTPRSTVFIEQEIGKEAHIARAMPLFLTLRDEDGKPHCTAMLPPGGRVDSDFACIIVGIANADPYVNHADAIAALGRHFDIALDRADCYPYRRG
jgi:hypothetical protein